MDPESWPSPPSSWPPPPPEAVGDNECLQRMLADGVLGDSRNDEPPLDDVWPPIDDRRLPSDHPQRVEFGRRSMNKGMLPGPSLRAEYAYAIPNDPALEALVELAPLVEIGAGGGYWAMLLRKRGADVVAYDPYPPPPEGRKRGFSHRLWSEVLVGHAEMAAEHPDRTLLTCWPEWEPHGGEDWPAQMLRCYGGDTVAYIGEPAGDASGTPVFHDLLHERFECEREITIPRWFLSRDSLTIWRRRARRLRVKAPTNP